MVETPEYAIYSNMKDLAPLHYFFELLPHSGSLILSHSKYVVKILDLLMMTSHLDIYYVFLGSILRSWSSKHKQSYTISILVLKDNITVLLLNLVGWKTFSIKKEIKGYYAKTLFLHKQCPFHTLLLFLIKTHESKHNN